MIVLSFVMIYDYRLFFIYILHLLYYFFFFFTAPSTTEIYTLSLHDALPIYRPWILLLDEAFSALDPGTRRDMQVLIRSEEHTSELQSRPHLVCRLLLEKKKKIKYK